MWFCCFIILFVLCADVTPSAVHVGNIVQGARMATASGRDMRVTDEESHMVTNKLRIDYVTSAFLILHNFLMFVSVPGWHVTSSRCRHSRPRNLQSHQRQSMSQNPRANSSSSSCLSIVIWRLYRLKPRLCSPTCNFTRKPSESPRTWVRRQSYNPVRTSL